MIESARSFLDNIVETEKYLHSNIFAGRHAFSRDNPRGSMVVRIVATPTLFGEKVYGGDFKGGGYVSYGVGCVISDLRQRGVEDDLIYSYIFDARKEFILSNNISSSIDVVNKHASCDLFDFVRKKMVEFAGFEQYYPNLFNSN